MKNKLLKVFCCIFFLLASVTLKSQNYTWMKGATTYSQSGVYGSLSVPSSSNCPGSRNYQLSWKDTSDNFWIYAGEGYDKYGNVGGLSDLWKYAPATNMWTWVKGDSMCYKPAVYGAQGIASPTVTPGHRDNSATWADANGNLWLFGGYSPLFGYVSDMWKYNIASNQWTLVMGTSAPNLSGIYGTQGVASVSNIPGSRMFPESWVDNSGIFWMFGGFGNSSNNVGVLNDLWKFDPATSLWTWVNGSTLADQNGIYGILGVPSSSSCPGARKQACSWKDSSGNFWIFGGQGYDATSTSTNYDLLNDLWKYNISTNQWTWINGSSASQQYGTYGSLGVFTSTNEPGAREAGLSVTDNTGRFWLFGGTGLSTPLQTGGALNDLWLYDPALNQWALMKGSDTCFQTGIYGTQGVSNAINRPGGRFLSSGWTDKSNDLWIFGGLGVDASNPLNDLLNDLWKFTNCYTQSVSATSSNSIICSGQTATLTINGANTYSWNNAQNNSSITVSPSVTTTYSAIVFYNNGCSDTAFVTQNVNLCAGIVASYEDKHGLLIYPNPNTGEFLITHNESDLQHLVIFNALGQKVFEQHLNAGESLVNTRLCAGLYQYQITTASEKNISGKLLVN